MAQSDAPSTQPARPTTGPDRFLVGIVAGTVLLVVISIIVVLIFGQARSTPPPDPNGPAGVVYSYVEAVRAGDADRARTYLTAQARTDFDTRLRTSPLRPVSDERVRIVVDTVSQTDSAAEVKVTISRFYARSEPFSSNTSHRYVTARLIREDGTWKLSQAPFSYDLY